ncbi:MAG TPA: glycosyltransferase N-terminal domain-containing protein [Chitinophagaceae bacterium]|nr:glycosyltransferase N-terminal domain-containing protein [Chitinophagaceae bacterium]
MNLFLYQLFLWLYKAGVRTVAPWNSKARRWLEGRVELLASIRKSLEHNTAPLIWMHCASLGEFEQGRPVIEKLKHLHPSHKILITFYSPSGYEVVKNYKGADHIFYLPSDSLNHAKEFIEIAKPSLVLWVKYDYWYYYLNELRKRNIPVLLISGLFRKDHVFFKWYGGLQRQMLHAFTHFFVQTEGSEHQLQKIGFNDNVTVSGDTRFDRVIEIAEKFQNIDVIENFCRDHQVIVAGSTWEDDEEELNHFANTNPKIKFIIAPHEISEDGLKETEKLFKNSIRYSILKKYRNPEANVLIIDNIGMLSKLYRYSTIAFVGGAFGDDGVHNVLEAAVYGKPVIFGPVYDKYIEAVELVGSGGGFSIENALEVEELFNQLLNNSDEYGRACEASKEYVYSKRGATEKILQFIQEKRLLTS